MSEFRIVQDYPHPMAKVWRALTDPTLIPLWTSTGKDVWIIQNIRLSWRSVFWINVPLEVEPRPVHSPLSTRWASRAHLWT